MAVKSNLGRFTRSRRIATSDGLSDELANEPVTRTFRSKNCALSVSEKTDNCKVVITKLKSEYVNTVRPARTRSSGRKRRRVESEDEAVIQEEEDEEEEEEEENFRAKVR